MALPRRRIRPEAWTPIGVDALEPNALDVVRSTDHRSVIAGPGAGKTELLAQRASFVLQTGASRSPQRILAICFKRDAAYNLAARVRLRCRPEQAGRLDSLTFDAFAKGLVDRFGQALSDEWRPSTDYEIMSPNERDYRLFLGSVGDPPSGIASREQVEAIGTREFERTHLLGARLPERRGPPRNAVEWAVDRYWRTFLRGPSGSSLSFPMIGRLAELLLRANPVVRRALALTYSHVFLDEFQDTTHIQYDLIATTFLGTPAIITAVGDNKQQIMRWAMAMEAPFAALERDFGARRTPLLNNYRSSPDLVRIQHVLAQALDEHSVMPVSKVVGTVSGDSCAVLDFSSPEAEAERLAAFIRKETKDRGLHPREFVLLVRQKASDYFAVLGPALARQGIHLRNEAAAVGEVTLQDLLAEEVSEWAVRLLRLSTTDRAGRLWTDCLDELSRLRGIAFDEHAERSRLARELDEFTHRVATSYPTPVTDGNQAQRLVAELITFVGRSALVAAHPAYRQGDWMAKVTDAVRLHLANSCANTEDWSKALDAYQGLDAVPLMTIHKSKGLEYHTVIFVGLDDGAWWSFERDRIEATAGFFVAFTRAKQRVFFTYCPGRGARNRISTLYELLKSAGVRVFKIA